jgi:hypothetical protein
LKNVLIISYYWPPSGGPGVQRVLKFCKYLPNFGWNPIVLTVKDGEFPVSDFSLEKDSKAIESIKVKGISFHSIFKLFAGKQKLPTHQLSPGVNENFITKFARWLRYNLIIPDGRVGWYWNAVKRGKKIIQEKNIDLIFSSGPPQTVHLIGRSLAKKTDTAWVADFRDPWTDRFYYYENHRNSIISYLDKYLERKVLRDCDYLVTVSKGFFSLLNNNWIIDNKTEIIYNGYDIDDFKEIKKGNTSNNSITISHIGSLSRSQIPLGLFNSVKLHNQSKKNKPILIKCIGSVHSSIENYVMKNGLDEFLSFEPYMNHDLAIQEMVKSDILFLVIPNLINNQGIIPGKLFEYFASKTNIILIGNKNSDAAKLMKDLGYQFFYDINENINFDNILNNNYHDFIKIKAFNRIDQTKQLSKIFNKTILD